MNSFFVIFVASLVTCHLGPDDIDFKRNNALKLLYKDKKFTFLPENLQLSEGEKSNIRFACPEYYQYFSRTPSQHCIVPRNELQYEQCATEFVPIVDKVVSCDNGGTLYTLKYDVRCISLFSGINMLVLLVVLILKHIHSIDMSSRCYKRPPGS